MEPLKIDVAYLLADESFINYCKKSSKEDVQKWEAFILNNPSNALLANEAEAIFNQLFTTLLDLDIEEQETRLFDKLIFNESASIIPMQDYAEKPKKSILSFFLKLTAAAVLLIGIFFTIKNYNVVEKKEIQKTFAAINGERKNLQLPDGSIVILNSGSKIYINEYFGVTARDVFLEGEAFFDVKHNKDLPFIVHTAAMDVRAVGTAFNVKAYIDEKVTETSLVRGLIEVTIKEDKNRKLILHPNQKVRWSLEEDKMEGRITADLKTGKWSNTNVTDSLVQNITKTDEGVVKETAWTENKLIYTDESFANIAILLERWYGVKIEFKDDIVSQFHFTGNFEKEELGTVLSILKESKNFKYEISTTDKTLIKISK